MLHRLEASLDQQVFETDRTSVRWSSAVERSVDSQLFERACDRGAFEEACLLYRGDFLAGSGNYFRLGGCLQSGDPGEHAQRRRHWLGRCMLRVLAQA